MSYFVVKFFYLRYDRFVLRCISSPGIVCCVQRKKVLYVILGAFKACDFEGLRVISNNVFSAGKFLEMRVTHILKFCTKNLGKYPEKRFYCNSNTRLKAPLQILFWKCLERIFWNFDNSEKVFANVSLFLLCYRLADQNLLPQRKQMLTKVFPVSFARKQSMMNAFYWSNRITV